MGSTTFDLKDSEAFRQGLAENPHKALRAQGISIDDSVEVKLVPNLKDKLYFVLPSRKIIDDVNANIDAIVAGAKASTTGSVLSVSTAGSASSITSSVGCSSTASTLGSASSAL